MDLCQLFGASIPEGRTEDAEQGNKIVERMLVLIYIMLERGSTVSVENPWWSFLWCLMMMLKIMKWPNMELFEIHQCANGAETQKAIGILTNASWMKVARLHCHQVRPHRHLSGGLVGHC